jgi:hypothetical protein
MENIFKNELKFVVVELVGDAIRFPVWWYTTGLKKTARGCINSVKATEERWGLRIWAKNIFVPMFGEYDWQGRIISFFMRLFQIIARSIFVGIWAIIMFILFLAWLVLPAFILSQILYHWTVVFS